MCVCVRARVRTCDRGGNKGSVVSPGLLLISARLKTNSDVSRASSPSVLRPPGFLLFKDFCLNEIDEAVPQLKFYEEVSPRSGLDVFTGSTGDYCNLITT